MKGASSFVRWEVSCRGVVNNYYSVGVIISKKSEKKRNECLVFLPNNELNRSNLTTKTALLLFGTTSRTETTTTTITREAFGKEPRTEHRNETFFFSCNEPTTERIYLNNNNNNYNDHHFINHVDGSTQSTQKQ